jgi:peptide/nickel transport system permease protein
MSTDVTTLLTGPEPAPTSRGSRAIRMPRSPKIIAGLVILAVFAVLAIIGPAIAPYSPNEINQNWVKITCQQGPGLCIGEIKDGVPGGYVPLEVPLGPSSAHPLGTTLLGQDVWSQLLNSTRPTLVVAFLAGLVATALSISDRGQRRVPGRQC